MLPSFILGLLIAYVMPFKIILFSTIVEVFINGFLFLSPLIVFVIVFNSTCSLLHERDQAGDAIRKSLVLFGLLVLCCSLFASLVLASLSPLATSTNKVLAGAPYYLGQVLFLSALRPVSLALVLAFVIAFLLSRTSLFNVVIGLSKSVYAFQEKAFRVLVTVFPVISLSLGATLYYNLGNVSLEAYAFSMCLTLALGLVALIALAVIVKTFTETSLARLGTYSARMFATALAIGSSYLALPMALRIFRDYFRTRRRVADLVLTLGTSLNRCGSVMGVLAVSFMAARYTGIELSSQQMLLLAVPIAIIGFGAPGVQGGTLLVSMPLILDVIISPDVAKFSAVALAIFTGGTTFIQSAVNNVASGYIALLVASPNPRRGPIRG